MFEVEQGARLFVAHDLGLTEKSPEIRLRVASARRDDARIALQ